MNHYLFMPSLGRGLLTCSNIKDVPVSLTVIFITVHDDSKKGLWSEGVNGPA